MFIARSCLSWQNEQTISWVKYCCIVLSQGSFSKSLGEEATNLDIPLGITVMAFQWHQKPFGMKPTSIWAFYRWIISSMDKLIEQEKQITTNPGNG